MAPARELSGTWKTVPNACKILVSLEVGDIHSASSDRNVFASCSFMAMISVGRRRRRWEKPQPRIFEGIPLPQHQT